MLDKARVREIAYEYSGEVLKMLTPVKIILFGSYLNSTPHEYSYIDIAVLVNDYRGDWDETVSKLIGLKWDDKFTYVEPHLLDEAYDPSGFVEHVIRTGEVVYQRL